MAAAGFSTVLQIDTEEHGLRFAPAAERRPVADSGEDDLVGAGPGLARPAESIAGIAHAMNDRAVSVHASRPNTRIKAGVGEGVIEPRMEIPHDAGHAMARMGPAAVDTGVALQRVADDHAGAIAVGCAHLAAMGHEPRVGRIDLGAVLPSATGHAAGIGRSALHAPGRFSPNED